MREFLQKSANQQTGPQSIENAFREYVSSVKQMPDDAWRAAKKKLYRAKLERGEHALRVGDVESQIRFIADGILRQYYEKNGREFNKEIYLAPEYISSYTSFLTRTPSEYSIQALDTTHMLILDFESVQELYRDYPYWEHIGRKVTEQKYILKEKREALLLLENPAERYEWLLREKPDFLHHLNLYEIASYLGVTQETLSRVRNRRANRISV